MHLSLIINAYQEIRSPHSLFVNKILSVHCCFDWIEGIDYKRAIFTKWRSGQGEREWVDLVPIKSS